MRLIFNAMEKKCGWMEKGLREMSKTIQDREQQKSTTIVKDESKENGGDIEPDNDLTHDRESRASELSSSIHSGEIIFECGTMEVAIRESIETALESEELGT
jgi:hypothetical protein